MKRTLLLIGLLVPLSMLLSSCGFNRGVIVVGDEPGPVVLYHYWYYPGWGIYYDYDTHVYFYLEAGTWHRSAYLPQRYHGLGRHVIVESERDRPWARYEEHRAKYPPGHIRKEMREDEEDRGPGDGHRKHHFDDD